MLYTILSLAADALWIIALSIMGGASRQAWRRIPAGEPTPLIIRKDGSVAASAPRALALCAIPGVAFGVGLALLGFAASTRGQADFAMIAFGLRATLAASFALAHLTWLRRALDVLDARGVLKA